MQREFKHSLFKKLFQVTIFLVIIPFVAGNILTYFVNYNSLKKQTQAVNTELLAVGKKRVEDKLSSICGVPLVVYTDNDSALQNSLRSLQKYTMDETWRIKNKLRSVLNDNSNILRIDLQGNNGEIISQYRFVSGNKLEKLISRNEYTEGFSVVEENGIPTMVIYRKTLVDYPDNMVLCTMTIYYDLKAFQKIAVSLKRKEDNSVIMMLNKSNNKNFYLSEAVDEVHYDQNQLFQSRFVKGSLNGRKGFFYSMSAKTSGVEVEIIKFVDEYIIILPALSVVKWVGLIQLIIFVLVIIYIIFVYRGIVKPIRRIAYNMDKVQTGIYEYHASATSNDEIGMLDNKYEEMVNSINVLINKDMRNILEVSKAQLKMLQAQINPHFLNNMLQYIGTQALCQGAEDVNESLSHLGRIFQYNMDTTHDYVQFRDEVDHINNYLELQQGRFSGKLQCEIYCTQDSLEVTVPKMILQPLVENSIHYGNHTKGAGIVINISSNIYDNILEIRVSDNGMGFSAEKINEIKEQYQHYQMMIENGHGIGLLNVLERLKIYSDEKFKWEIQSEPYKKTEVILRVPVKEERYEGIDS